MHQNLHGLAAEEERGDAATAMRGHGDEVAAAGTSGFDDGLMRLPMLYFHHLTRDADQLGLLLCLGKVTFGLSMAYRVYSAGASYDCGAPRSTGNGSTTVSAVTLAPRALASPALFSTAEAESGEPSVG